MNGVEYRDRFLQAHIALKVKGQNMRKVVTRETKYQQHVNSNLFALVLEIIDIRTRHALGSIGQEAAQCPLPRAREAGI